MNVKNIAKKEPKSLIGKAYIFAEKAHNRQKRASGEPYFNHSIYTANFLLKWKLDDETIAAGLLHDVVEDTSISLEKIEEEFGKTVSFLVEGITKLGKIKYRGTERQIESIKKLILASSEDIRVLLIKLADRYHNIQTLRFLPKNKQKRIALETYEIYAPLAYRLGMQHLSGELEDLAFPYINPDAYKWLQQNIKIKYEDREKYLTKIKPIVVKALAKANIKPLKVSFRAKRYSSLYKKLLRYDMDIEKIYDLVAFRIIVSSIEDCYAVLGIIHKLWPPFPGRIKDYIAMPKPNGYKSLHTVVIAVEGQIVEFQIRTVQMHEEAENGIAAHWAYEEKKGSKSYARRKSSVADKKELRWVQQLRAWQKEQENSEEFIESMKIDFFKDRIFAITPKGEVIDLPAGATPVDFAYRIHSDIGNQCMGAKVNGKIMPLAHKLLSGDVVEISTQKGKKPSSSWLEFVRTEQAKHHIKKSLSQKKGIAFPIKPKKTEFRILAKDRIGIIKDISIVISRSHIGISSINSSSETHGGFHVVKITCDINDLKKAQKTVLKLKNIKEVKEIEYKLV